MNMKRHLLPCAVTIGIMAIVSCDTVTLTEQPSAVDATATLEGYPDIQAMINASLDDAIAVVDAAAARSAEPDPRYANLSRTLKRERDEAWATQRALDPDHVDDVTEAQRDEMDVLMADDPALDAAFGALADELAAAYAALPPIEVTVQDLDESGEPVGEPHVIRSVNGIIDLGFQTYTVAEFLLRAQSQAEVRPDGFVIGTHYESGAKLWPSDTVKYFFDSTIDNPGSVRSWMWWKFHYTQHATGIVFKEYDNTSSRLYEWERQSSPYLRVARKELGCDPFCFAGQATIGKVKQSLLYIDDDLALDEKDGEPTFYHEAGHVIGLLHEHQREDRGYYVYVYRTGSNYDRIFQYRNKRICYFWIFCFWTAVQNSTMYDTPYDYSSVMHYLTEDGSIKLRARDGESWKAGDIWDVRKHNKRTWGDVNHNTFFTPWDIYVIKRRYGITPNPKPKYTPKPTNPRPPS